MPTTTLTVDNELLSATSIEAAKEARDLMDRIFPNRESLYANKKTNWL